MNNKKHQTSTSFALFYVVVILIGVLLFAVFSKVNTEVLSTSLEKAISFVEQRLDRYDRFQANDRVRSYVNLADKTMNFSTIAENRVSNALLKQYADEQRLAGIYVLDENMDTVAQYIADKSEYYCWDSWLEKDEIQDIMNHSEETYTMRIEKNDYFYDFAVVSRKGETGLIIAYVKNDSNSVYNGDMTLATLFADFPLENKGTIIVSDGDSIVGSNDTEFINKSVEEFRTIYQSDYDTSKDIITIKANGQKYLGRRTMNDSYAITIFFPAQSIYTPRNIVCLVYFFVALIVCLAMHIAKGSMQKAALVQSQKRMSIINALGRAYMSIFLVNIEKGTVETIKCQQLGEDLNFPEEFAISSRQQIIETYVDSDYQQEFTEFIDMHTAAERFKSQEVLTYTALDAENKWFMTVMLPQRYDTHNNLTHVLIANRDITEDRQKEEQQKMILENALKSAKQANNAKTIFLNNMSHDIRTPMNAIVGFAKLARSHVNDKDKVIDYLGKIDTASRHLLNLINDILDMSRIESGNVRLEEGAISLPDAICDLQTIVQSSVNAKQLALEVNMQDIVHEDIITDKLRFNQLFLNILGNAIKFTQVGGRISFNIKEVPPAKSGYAAYEFKIKDNGIGMSEDFVDHIFDSFSRERTVTENGIQGSGLGMAIAKSIVDMMGGSISVESQKGVGSEFTVTAEFMITEHAPQKEPVLAEKQQGRHKGKRILLVEDNELNREIATTILEEAGMLVDSVEDGSDAVVRMVSAPDEQYDIILMDIQMPRMDGYTATKEIRTLGSNTKANIPIVAMTANAFDEDKRKALEAGMNSHIAKPIDIEKILATFDEIFGTEE